MGKIILIASGKGGVGKTTMTSNIAACLAKRGRKVLCFDADLRLRNLDILLNLSDQAIFDIQDLYLNRCTFDKAHLTHELHENLYFIPGPAALTEDPEAVCKYLIELAKEKESEFDYIFIDCPAGVGLGFQSLLKRGCEVIVVATPELTSMRDAEITADMAWEKGCPVRLLVNRIRPDLMRKGLAPDVDDIIDASAVQLLGIVPEDRRVLISSGSSRLLCDMRRSLCLRAIENISARLDGENRELLEFNKTKA